MARTTNKHGITILDSRQPSSLGRSRQYLDEVRPATPTAIQRRPVYPGRTQVNAWRRDAEAIERAVAGREPDEAPGATNRRCWGWVALFFVGFSMVLFLAHLWRNCWSLSQTIGC